MAALITMSIIVAVAGVLFGAYLKICFAIRQEDGQRGSLRSAPPTSPRRVRATSCASAVRSGTRRRSLTRTACRRRGPAGGLVLAVGTAGGQGGEGPLCPSGALGHRGPVGTPAGW